MVAALIENPTTKKGLVSKAIISSAEKSDEAELALSVVCDAREATNVTKGQCSNDSQAATQTALGFLCGDKVKNKRMKTKVSKMLNIHRKRVGRAYNHWKKVLKGEKSCWTYTKQHTRTHAIPAEHLKLAHDFWASPDISRTTPNKRDIVRKRLAPKIYVPHPKHTLEKMQTEAYMEFKIKHPEMKMGRVSARLKAVNLFTLPHQDRTTGYLVAAIYMLRQGWFSSCVWDLEDKLASFQSSTPCTNI